MYICVCNGINEHRVAAAIEGGAAKVADIYRANGCAPRCGQCIPVMREKLAANSVVDVIDAD